MMTMMTPEVQPVPGSEAKCLASMTPGLLRPPGVANPMVLARQKISSRFSGIIGLAMKRSWNYSLWAGFAVTLMAPLSYFLVFVRWPVTRDVPWSTYILFAAGLGLLTVGVRRAWQEPERYRGRIAGGILGLLSIALLGLFAWGTAYASKQLPASQDAPRVGDRAPDFSLVDKDGTTVSLPTLLDSPFSTEGGRHRKTNGAVLIFYRGYW